MNFMNVLNNTNFNHYTEHTDFLYFEEHSLQNLQTSKDKSCTESENNLEFDEFFTTEPQKLKIQILYGQKRTIKNGFQITKKIK